MVFMSMLKPSINSNLPVILFNGERAILARIDDDACMVRRHPVADVQDLVQRQGGGGPEGSEDPEEQNHKNLS